MRGGGTSNNNEFDRAGGDSCRGADTLVPSEGREYTSYDGGLHSLRARRRLIAPDRPRRNSFDTREDKIRLGAKITAARYIWSAELLFSFHPAGAAFCLRAAGELTATPSGGREEESWIEWEAVGRSDGQREKWFGSRAAEEQTRRFFVAVLFQTHCVYATEEEEEEATYKQPPGAVNGFLRVES